MSAVSILIKARESRIELHVDGDKIVLRGPRTQVQGLRREVVENKAELLRLLRNAELVASVRQRFAAACERLKINSSAVLAQFDAWRYCAANLQEMSHWSDEVIEAHCRLLADELDHGLTP